MMTMIDGLLVAYDSLHIMIMTIAIITIITNLLVWWNAYDSLDATLAPREVAHIMDLIDQSITRHHHHFLHRHHQHHHIHNPHELT